MSIRVRTLAVLVVLFALAGCGPSQPTATRTPPPATTIAPLPTPPAATPAPEEGGVLAYVAWDRTTNRNDIYLLDAGGGAPRLLPNTTRAWAPNWSPDGSRIAYIVHRNDNDWPMYVVNADGSNLQRLTHGSLDHFPAWSPDGTQIAFARNGSLWIMRVSAGPAATAGDLRQLTADPKQYVSGPAWSPDGTQIAFASQAGNPHGTASYEDPKTAEIYLVNADGSNLRKLSDNQAADTSPAWSPDGTRIAFVSDRDGSSQIYVMDPGGGRVQRLTDDHANDSCPAWSPDGARIAFCSDRDGKGGDYHFQIYIMNADGSEQTRLTDAPTTDMYPAWKPVSAATPLSPTPAVPAGATTTPAADGMVLVFDEQRALEHVAYLAGDDLEGRRSGTPGGQKAGDYIAARFAEYGLLPAGSGDTYFQPFTTVYTTIVESPILIATFPNPDLSSGAALSRTYTYHTEYLPRIPGYLGSGDATGQVAWLGACDPGDLDATLASKILLCRSPSADRYDRLVERSLNYRIGGLLLIREDEGPYVRPSYRLGELSALPAFQITESIAQDLLAGTQYTLDDLDELSAPVPLSATVHMAASFQAREIEARNVLGLLPGTDPQLKDEIVVIGAHYDHMGRDPDGTIYNGANDNASGVSVMLEVARLWHAQGFRPARSVLFAAWDDEEQGLLGSRYYVLHPIGSLLRTVTMLNLDMVGVGEELHFGGRGVVATQLQASAKACHIEVIIDPEAGGSDDTPFLDAGIPAGSIFWTSDSVLELAYHQPEDDTGNILPGNLKTAGILAAHAMAAWSGTGGDALAFVSERKGNQDIFFMNADGSGQAPLTTSSSNEGWPSWSPDGTQIAFHAGYPSVIKILNLADGTTRQLPVDLGGNLWEPAWSHDGKRIAFAHASSATVSDIYVANLDGTGLQQLAGNGKINGGPVWSPDDRQIAFYTDRDGDFEVYVMDAGGEDQRRLTDSPGEDVATSWSPDGTRIAFQSKRDGNAEIYVVDADASNLTRLTDNEVDDLAPAWSPDGTMIAYDSGKGSEKDIYVMNADGTEVRRLTDTPGKDYYPVWQPNR